MKTLQELYTKYGKDILEASIKHDLDEAILGGLIWVESHGESSARSPCGAYGLTQVMPLTAKDRGYDLSTPKGQIFAGADYLSWVLKTFAKGNIEDALGGYNSGPGRIRGQKWKMIAESKKYTPAVLEAAEAYRKLIAFPAPIIQPVKVASNTQKKDWKTNRLRG